MTEPQEPKPDLSTTLAIERTRVAYDRTVMAWIRTSVSGIDLSNPSPLTTPSVELKMP